MEYFGTHIRNLRQERGLLLREVAARLEIDPSLLSRIERGVKQPTRDMVVRLAPVFKVREKDLMIHFLSDRVLYALRDEKFALEAVQVAEENLVYKRKRGV
jgi:transcriptional regulator with XRE-family HTH domain